MLDDILDLFNRRKRQHETDRTPARPQSGLPFDLPFLDEEEDDEGRDRRHDDDRRSERRHSSGTRHNDGDWF